MFKKLFKSVLHKKAKGGLLIEAYTGLIGKVNFKHIANLADKKGIFGHLTDKFVLVAKQYIYGDVVSAHIQAVYSALNNGVPLVMYIGTVKTYYRFEPKEIIRKGIKNEKGEAVMLNFGIRHGEKYV